MIVSAIDASSTAIAGLYKAQKTAEKAAETIASSTLPISGGPQMSASPSLIDAFVSLMAAKTSFEANAATIKIGDAMLQTLINSV